MTTKKLKLKGILVLTVILIITVLADQYKAMKYPYSDLEQHDDYVWTQSNYDYQRSLKSRGSFRGRSSSSYTSSSSTKSSYSYSKSNYSTIYKQTSNYGFSDTNRRTYTGFYYQRAGQACFASDYECQAASQGTEEDNSAGSIFISIGTSICCFIIGFGCYILEESSSNISCSCECKRCLNYFCCFSCLDSRQSRKRQFDAYQRKMKKMNKDQEIQQSNIDVNDINIEPNDTQERKDSEPAQINFPLQHIDLDQNKQDMIQVQQTKQTPTDNNQNKDVVRKTTLKTQPTNKKIAVDQSCDYISSVENQ